MKQFYKVDVDGFYTEPIITDNEISEIEGAVEIQPPNGFYKPKWTGTEWIEGMTQAEIDVINNRAREPIEDEVLRDYVLDVDYRLILMELGL